MCRYDIDRFNTEVGRGDETARIDSTNPKAYGLIGPDRLAAAAASAPATPSPLVIDNRIRYRAAAAPK